MNRIEYVALYDVSNSNPNGDPDNENQPRMYDDGHGYITDVCIKRKLRNVAEADGKQIMLRSGTNINEVMHSTNNHSEDFWDVRLFGAVITGKSTKKGENLNKQYRGPVQLEFARSVSTINPVQVCITSSVGRKEDQTQTMGNKWVIPHAVYRQHIFVNASLANKIGIEMSEIEQLEKYIMTMLEHDRSAARPNMSVRGLYRIEHQSTIGLAPSWQTLESVQVTPLITPSYSWSDYVVTVDTNAERITMMRGDVATLVPGVTITRVV